MSKIVNIDGNLYAEIKSNIKIPKWIYDYLYSYDSRLKEKVIIDKDIVTKEKLYYPVKMNVKFVDIDSNKVARRNMLEYNSDKVPYYQWIEVKEGTITTDILGV